MSHRCHLWCVHVQLKNWSDAEFRPKRRRSRTKSTTRSSIWRTLSTAECSPMTKYCVTIMPSTISFRLLKVNLLEFYFLGHIKLSRNKNWRECRGGGDGVANSNLRSQHHVRPLLPDPTTLAVRLWRGIYHLSPAIVKSSQCTRVTLYMCDVCCLMLEKKTAVIGEDLRRH